MLWKVKFILDSQKKCIFYIYVFNVTSFVFTSIVSFVHVISRPVIGLWMNAEWESMWEAGVIVLLDVLFLCLLEVP
jgi:hypothetical protein